MKVVVDTNIIFSAILNSDSTIGQILLYAGKSFEFYSSNYLKKEINNHIDKLKKITNLESQTLAELIELIYSKINFISEDLIPKETLIIAEKLTRKVDFDDVMFVALSIHLNSSLWTGDKVLVKELTKKGFNQFLSTNDLLNLLR
jgi:putative PIN family toxin of toxin-antitoxin system